MLKGCILAAVLSLRKQLQQVLVGSGERSVAPKEDLSSIIAITALPRTVDRLTFVTTLRQRERGRGETFGLQ